MGSALITTWSGAWLVWIRTDLLGKAEDPSSATTGLGEGVVLIRTRLIPVAPFEPGAQVRLVRQGTIPMVPLPELRWGENANG